MTKSQIIGLVSSKTGTNLEMTSNLVNATLDTITQALKAKQVVKLTGFGSFVPDEKGQITFKPGTGF